MGRSRILFVVENITTAQVVRLLALAKSLDPARYEVHFASSTFPEVLFAGSEFVQHGLYTIEPATVLSAVEGGKQPYDTSVLSAYVEADRALMAAVRPDVVIGDFRLSLTISAPRARVPLLTLINAHWSPHADRPRFPLPDHPILDLVGLARAEKYFPLALPKVLALFAAPINALRKRYGLTPIGNLLDVLTYGDMTLFADVPALAPVTRLEDHHVYLGPITWSPEVPLPPSVAVRDAGRPLVYVTLGSSGRIDLLQPTLEALGNLPVEVVVATAGRVAPGDLPDAVYGVDLLPGDRAARAASLVVCNGGTATAYQALLEGTPVVGIATNLDQYLAMDAIERFGAGRLVRGGSATASIIEEAARLVLASEEHRRGADRARAALRSLDPFERFGVVLRRILGKAG